MSACPTDDPVHRSYASENPQEEREKLGMKKRSTRRPCIFEQPSTGAGETALTAAGLMVTAASLGPFAFLSCTALLNFVRLNFNVSIKLVACKQWWVISIILRQSLMELFYLRSACTCRLVILMTQNVWLPFHYMSMLSKFPQSNQKNSTLNYICTVSHLFY